MNSPNLTTVPLPPTNGRSIGDDSRRPASRGMLREPGHRIKTGENSRPTNGEYSTPAHKWVRAFAADPEQAFPGRGQTKPDQLEVERLRREVQKLKAERDILKKAAAYFAKEST